MKFIKRIVHFIKRRLGKLTSKDFVEYLREHDVAVGEGTHFFDWKNTIVDIQRPWLLEIGEYCKITSGVTILAHDYSRSVLRRVYGEILEGGVKTVIGNNVFLGINTIVLPGTNIGDNSIIGAGSVCRGIYPPNCVIAGNPAKVICTLDDYYRKRKEKYVDEAIETACLYYRKYNRWPDIYMMGEFFPLYLDRTTEAIVSNRINTSLCGDNKDEIEEFFFASTKIFQNYEEFLKLCEKRL